MIAQSRLLSPLPVMAVLLLCLAGCTAMDRKPESGVAALASPPYRSDFEAVFSPDGSTFALTSHQDGNADIYLMNEDGSGMKRLTFHPGQDLHASWSPDGTRLAFVSDRDGDFERYVIARDGTGLERVTHHPAHDGEYAAWTPDGEHLIFHSDRDGGDFDLYRIRTDGSDLQRLTDNPAQDYLLSMSADGTTVAFTSNRDAGNSDIYVLRFDGSDPVRLTHHAERDRDPSLSPDGTQVAFISGRDGNFEIYRMSLDGSAPSRLTVNRAWDFNPQWSPDGRRIVFASRRDGRLGVYVMNADGSDQRKITNFSLSPFVTLASDLGAEEAVERIREARERSPETTFLFEPEAIQLGGSLLDQGREEEAIRVLELGIELFPGSFGIHQVLGDAYRAAGRAAPPTERDLLDQFRHGPISLALDSLETAERRFPAWPLLSEGSLSSLGHDLLQGERIADAIEVFRLATEEFPESAEAFDSLGEAYLKAGEKTLSVASYERAVDLSENNPAARRRLDLARAD